MLNPLTSVMGGGGAQLTYRRLDSEFHPKMAGTNIRGNFVTLGHRGTGGVGADRAGQGMNYLYCKV